MSEGFRHGHYVLGIEGLALLRAGARRKLDRLEDRVHDLHEVLESLDEPPC